MGLEVTHQCNTLVLFPLFDCNTIAIDFEYS